MKSFPFAFALCCIALTACGDDPGSDAQSALRPRPKAEPATAAAAHAPTPAPPDRKRPLPPFEADCPGDVRVVSDKEGLVKINDAEALIESVGDREFEATDPVTGIVLGITRSATQSREVSVAYTGLIAANGKNARAVCKVAGRT